ncbi:MAG: ABC transporter permease, partial [Paludibacteraceae bacterium]
MDFFNEIWETIARNRSRSLLTGFGVFWGMMMLLLLVGMGNSLVDGIRYQLEGVATNSCIVGANNTGKAYKGLQKGRAWDIRNGDIPHLEREVTAASTIAYVRFIGSWEKNTHRGDKVGTYNLLGVSENLQQALCTPLQYGRFINSKDVEQQRKVCVIGEQTYRDLFPEGGDITGQCITVSGI